jgi:hypothetical protein
VQLLQTLQTDQHSKVDAEQEMQVQAQAAGQTVVTDHRLVDQTAVVAEAATMAAVAAEAALQIMAPVVVAVVLFL